MVDGLVLTCLAGGLVDQPDLDGVVNKPVFAVDDPDDHGCVLLGGEVAWVSLCLSCWSEQVELGEGLPGLWHGDDVDEGDNDNDDGEDKDDGERLVYSVLLVWDGQVQLDDESLLWIGFSPAVYPKQSDAKDEE